MRLNRFNNVLACVTQQKSCERLIHKAATLKSEDGSLYVIHVSKQKWNFFDNTKDGEAMEYLFSVSKSYGADMTVLNSDRVVETIAQFAQHYQIDLIVIGGAPEGRSNEFAQKLQNLLGDSKIAIQVEAMEQVKSC
jgi:K+-sensing histidine kinase KdpD